MIHRLKINKKPLPTVAVIDNQSVTNTATTTQTAGFDGGKLIKGRSRFLIVDTMCHLL
jgi:putative transposase